MKESCNVADICESWCLIKLRLVTDNNYFGKCLFKNVRNFFGYLNGISQNMWNSFHPWLKIAFLFKKFNYLVKYFGFMTYLRYKTLWIKFFSSIFYLSSLIVLCWFPSYFICYQVLKFVLGFCFIECWCKLCQCMGGNSVRCFVTVEVVIKSLLLQDTETSKSSEILRSVYEIV